MYKVISPSSCRESAKVLQETLNDFYPTEREIVINWGNSEISRTPSHLVFGNKTNAVARSANKAVFLSLCKDLETVPVISSYEGPCYQHHAYLQDGQGVKFVDKESDFIQGVLTTKQIIGDEYRVYFCYDGPKQIYRKVKLNQHTPNNPIQTSVNGYGYEKNPTTLRTITNLKDILTSDTEKVAKRLEMSYGVVDFIVSKGDYSVYILECNSAPTLIDEPTLTTFAKYIALNVGN